MYSSFKNLQSNAHLYMILLTFSKIQLPTVPLNLTFLPILIHIFFKYLFFCDDIFQGLQLPFKTDCS
jgi:hypothetical protein